MTYCAPRCGFRTITPFIEAGLPRSAARGDGMGQPRAVPRLGVLVAHPLHTARAGLGLLIDGEPGLEVLAQANTCEEAAVALRRLRRRTRIVLLVALSGD